VTSTRKENFEKPPELFRTCEQIEHAIRRVDDETIGDVAVDLITRLFPICRSITGNGVRDSLAILKEYADLQIREVPTGRSVFDWTVPKEWNIRDAYVKNQQGERVIDFKRSNLHVLNYSVPVSAIMTLEELRPHLYTLPDQPNAIPYRMSYYEERWGFCLTHQDLKSLPEGTYEVFIDSTLEDGHLTIADAVLPGTSNLELAFSTYICHPSMANHELSGPVLSALLYWLLSECEHTYTYRFIYVPETIGALVYLAENGEHLQKDLLAGYVIASLGRPATYTYKRSLRGTTPADKVAEHCLQHAPNGALTEVIDFEPKGSDERQYCSPGFNLPVGLLTRPMYGTFPEYHTSLDDLEFVSGDALAESLKMCLRMVQVHELNRLYLNLSPYGEPQLGKRGLYSSFQKIQTGLNGITRQPVRSGTVATERESVERKMYLLAFTDGSHDLIDIANRIGAPAWEFAPEIRQLMDAGLLGLAD
jgi:aminopeptidase-like protein